MFNVRIDVVLKAFGIIWAALLCSISHLLKCDFLWPFSLCEIYHIDVQ